MEPETSWLQHTCSTSGFWPNSVDTPRQMRVYFSRRRYGGGNKRKEIENFPKKVDHILPATTPRVWEHWKVWIRTLSFGDTAISGIIKSSPFPAVGQEPTDDKQTPETLSMGALLHWSSTFAEIGVTWRAEQGVGACGCEIIPLYLCQWK